MRFAKWLGGAAWIGSWYLMYLEITRWHHVQFGLTRRPILAMLAASCRWADRLRKNSLPFPSPCRQLAVLNDSAQRGVATGLPLPIPLLAN